ncbi:MAG: type II toxin-antitoxin system VapC family toxin [Candidatus Dadabacteria bacterium]|nr:type II toxin-antitoxin system VapC family toxin [Candidatus Dadabacteria bacterium]NIS07556.1 type II toxin-antitoxin system VapC family toxin [Candidatus Dadabacteria bacterium]NIY21171.1 PIN domain-containing protein [Candidatus Dadabacteria bacterium]
MILIDTNLLLYAYDSSSRYHLQSLKWLEKVLSDNVPVRLAWITIVAFLRISTNHKIFMNPFSISESIEIVSEWLSVPVVDILNPTNRHWGILTKLSIEGQVTGPLIMDAYLAALAIEHGAKVYTTDKDFRRFDDLQVVYPFSDIE